MITCGADSRLTCGSEQDELESRKNKKSHSSLIDQENRMLIRSEVL